MKTLTYLLHVFAGAALASAAAQPVSSTITAVTVYPDLAIVTRSGSVTLPAGAAEIVFENLPASLIDESIQVSGRGDAEATILDVAARQTFLTETPDGRVKALEDELVDLSRQVQRLDDRNATLSEQREFTRRILTASTTPVGGSEAAPARPSIDDWERLLGFAGTTLNQIAEDGRALQVERESLVRRQDALRGQLAALRAAGQRSTKSVSVRLSAGSAGRLDLELAYSVPGASWAPAYDARLRTEAHAIELNYQAVVRQSTGEDWTSVAMTLSTARPALGAAAPRPTPWIVRVAPPSQAAMFARGQTTSGEVIRLNPFEVTESANDSFRAMSVGSGSRVRLEPADTPVAYAVTFVDTAVTSATFRVATPVSLASDNAGQKFPITRINLDSTLTYTATPKVSEAAYLYATATNTSDYPLLAGTVNSFLDDAFVATGSFRTVMPGEEFELGFGADEGVGIKRKLVNRYTEETGLGNRGRRVTYDLLVTITNNKRAVESISFREPLPVSQDERIAVKLQNPAERELGTEDRPRMVTRDEDGVLAWAMDLNPGEKREIPIKFAIEFPAEIPVGGLE